MGRANQTATASTQPCTTNLSCFLLFSALLPVVTLASTNYTERDIRGETPHPHTVPLPLPMPPPPHMDLPSTPSSRPTPRPTSSGESDTGPEPSMEDRLELKFNVLICSVNIWK